MFRVPEPELMNCDSQVKAYADADFSRSDDSLIFRLNNHLSTLGKPIKGSSFIVDLGCGPGNITERLARTWPKATVLGIDGSEAMLSVANSRKKLHNNFSTYKNLSYLNLNISSLSNLSTNLGQTPDLIVSNSFLHHLHDPHSLWKTVRNLSVSGTVNFHRDLRRPSTSKQAIDLQKKYLSDSPEILIRDYLASLHAAFTVPEVEQQLIEQGLDSLKVFPVEDRYLEVIGTF